MEPGNTRTVFVVQVDKTKDLSDAKRYGALRAVFGAPRKPYDTDKMVRSARRVLAEFQPGDHLLMVGDPALCALSAALVSEHCSTLNLLSWDRMRFCYVPQRWDLTPEALSGSPEDDVYPMAED